MGTNILESTAVNLACEPNYLRLVIYFLAFGSVEKELSMDTPMSVWLCSILAALNIVSYIAHLCDSRAKKRNTNISLFYLAFDILSAAEQVNLCHWYSSDVGKKSQSYRDHFAQRSRQWMTLSQMASVWMIFSFMKFFTNVFFSSGSFKRRSQSTILCGLYGLFVLIPLICGNSRRTIAEIVTTDFPHLLPYINPAVIYVVLYLFLNRIHPTRPDSMSLLSLAGLTSQAMVHGILTMSWAFMVRPQLNQISTLVWPALIMMYNFFLWPMVDNAIFAVLQGRLIWSALRAKKAISSEGQHEAWGKDQNVLSSRTVGDFYRSIEDSGIGYQSI